MYINNERVWLNIKHICFCKILKHSQNPLRFKPCAVLKNLWLVWFDHFSIAHKIIKQYLRYIHKNDDLRFLWNTQFQMPGTLQSYQSKNHHGNKLYFRFGGIRECDVYQFVLTLSQYCNIVFLRDKKALPVAPCFVNV